MRDRLECRHLGDCRGAVPLAVAEAATTGRRALPSVFKVQSHAAHLHITPRISFTLKECGTCTVRDVRGSTEHRLSISGSLGRRDLVVRGTCF
jgi:hypothetical protein